MKKEPHDKRQITKIALKIVASRIDKGEINPTNDAELRRATQEAVALAKEASFAAVDYAFK